MLDQSKPTYLLANICGLDAEFASRIFNTSVAILAFEIMM
jgi:hypothetical protein